MIEPKDKRTKEYKDWKASQEESKPMEGLGDLIGKVTEITGIKKAVKAVFGDECGCDSRKDKLNQMFSFRWNIECLEPEEYVILDEFFTRNPDVILPSEYDKLMKISNRVLNRRSTSSKGCVACVQKEIDKLRKIYEAYEA